jgi:hypothetical protein
VLGLRSWQPLVRWRFAPLTRDAETCLIELKWLLAILRRRLEHSAEWPLVGQVSTVSLVLFFQSMEIRTG